MEAAVAFGAGVRAHVLVGDARVLVERLLVAEGLRALRALERLLAEVHRLEVGPRDAGAREDLGALRARLAGHGCELLEGIESSAFDPIGAAPPGASGPSQGPVAV